MVVPVNVTHTHLVRTTNTRCIHHLRRVAPAHAARREQEPVHEDALAVVVGVVGEQPVPLVLLLAAAVAHAAGGACLGAHLLVDGLLEVFRVDHGSDLAGGVRRPVRSHDFHFTFACVDPGGKQIYCNYARIRLLFAFIYINC